MSAKSLLGAYTPFDPFLLGGAVAAYWAEDPKWTAPADGAPVTTWRDGTGNGRTLTTTRGTPRFRRASSLNGRPAIGFSFVARADLRPDLELELEDEDGPRAVGGDRMTTAAFATPVPQPNWYLAVLRLEGTVTAAQGRMFDNNPTVPRQLVGINNATTWFLQSGATTGLAAVASVLTPSWFVARFNGASSAVTYNGTTGANVNAGTTGVANIGLGHDNVGSGLVGAVAFAGLYTADPLLDPNWSRWRDWCRATYGTA